MKMLESERLILRNFKSEDAATIHTLFTDVEAMKWVDMWPPYTEISQTKDRVERWSSHDERLAIILKDTGACIGYIAINEDSEEEREDTRELGFAICAEYRRQGYMREALQAVLAELKNEGIVYVWACCFQGNEGSEAVIRSTGFSFVQEGTYDSDQDITYDSLEFRIVLNEA